MEEGDSASGTGIGEPRTTMVCETGGIPALWPKPAGAQTVAANKPAMQISLGEGKILFNGITGKQMPL
jgi:hypothetical protein